MKNVNAEQINWEDLEVGDWVEIDYGYERVTFYVLERYGNSVRLGTPRWLVSSATSMSIRELATKEPFYRGQGKFRWWWTLLPFRDLITPFSKAEGMF